VAENGDFRQGSHYPWVILGGGWINLSVTGNGDLPLATQRRVESILTPLAKIAMFCHPPIQILHPPHRLSTASLSGS
jgi:hypothetical protein